MSDDLNDVVPRERPIAFDSDSPRWQENRAAPGEVERYRRYRMDARPPQRGALDQDESIPGSSTPASLEAIHVTSEEERPSPS